LAREPERPRDHTFAVLSEAIVYRADASRPRTARVFSEGMLHE
jgi:hypothetical protein